MKSVGGAYVDKCTCTISVSKPEDTDTNQIDEPVVLTTPDSWNLFRYDRTSGQYIFNVATKSNIKGTVTVTVKPDQGDDGTPKTASFDLRT